MQKQRKVEIVDYDPAWAQVFADLQRVIAPALGELALAIEHVGSTAVPGLAAKPIVDLDVVIPARELLPEVIRRLGELGYEHEGDMGIPGREAFALPTRDVPRDGTGREWPRHHLYVCARDNAELARHLAFRDYLRAHPDQVLAYAELKRELARRYPYDVDAYSSAKAQFVESILRKATLIGDLQAKLQSVANPKTKAWWERYLKGAIPFRGVKMAGIRRALQAWAEEHKIAETISLDDQMELALSLIREAFAEDKLAGVLYLQEALLPQHAVQCAADLPRFARLFQEGHIHDWNVCDWFCIKVLGPLIEQAGATCAQAIAGWRYADNLWQRRASGVAFVNLAKHGDQNFIGFTELLLNVCTATVQHPERFAQTGTGWVLRELSLAEPERVIAFIETHVSNFSSEGLRYASERLPAEVKGRLRRQHRLANR